MAFQSLRFPVSDDTVAVDLFLDDLLDCNRHAGISPGRRLTESSEMFRRRYQCQYQCNQMPSAQSPRSTLCSMNPHNGTLAQC